MSEVKLFRPTELDARQWRRLQHVALLACDASFADYVDPEAYIDWNDFDRFRENHLDPNKKVGVEENANQEYRHPRVAVAYDGDDPISWAYSDRNVSGGGPPEGPHDDSDKARRARQLKRLSVVKNYLHYREDYTLPGYRHDRLAHQVGKRLLGNAIPLQPVAAYVYPDIYRPEIKSPLAEVQKLGFVTTGEVERQVPWASDPVRMVRVQARTAFGVWRKL